MPFLVCKVLSHFFGIFTLFYLFLSKIDGAIYSVIFTAIFLLRFYFLIYRLLQQIDLSFGDGIDGYLVGDIGNVQISTVSDESTTHTHPSTYRHKHTHKMQRIQLRLLIVTGMVEQKLHRFSYTFLVRLIPMGINHRHKLKVID